MYANDSFLKLLDSIKPDMVDNVYFGKQGCACGCGGNYHETPRMIKSAVTKMRKHLEDGHELELLDQRIICMELEHRAIRIYLFESVKNIESFL
jgi:hypothetical protein